MAKFDEARLRAIAALTTQGNQIFLNAFTTFNTAMANILEMGEKVFDLGTILEKSDAARDALLYAENGEGPDLGDDLNFILGPHYDETEEAKPA